MKISNVKSARVRGAVTRGLVTATAFASVTAVAAPHAAVAAPPAAPVAAAGIGTTDTQRVDAAAVVRLDPSP
ncbi:AbfB domain-containing protein, partial [Streptomyces lavendulocolor]